jgi:Leucine-rich repeat (LRR) protein
MVMLPGRPRPGKLIGVIVDLRGNVPASLAGVADGAYGLVVSESDLSALPDDVGGRGLRMLDVAHNHLTALPAGVAEMTAVEVLYLGDNRFTTVPDEVRPLRALRYLSVADNPIARLPSWIGELEHLVELRAQNTALTELPDEIGRLHALRFLDLRANGTLALPPALLDLPHLDRLDLRWNPYPELPPVAAALRDRGCFVLWP